MKKLKSRAFKDRLKGHKDSIIYLHSLDGPEGGILYSGSSDFAFRAWDLVNRVNKFKVQI
jgi:F-box and WD-40 domain protein 1/11/F-box/WD-40 domain protein 7